MSEARALTSVISNACAVIFVSMWERACDRARLKEALSLVHEPEEAFDQPADLPG
jgi:Na+/H+-dicarboxylate symporter